MLLGQRRPAGLRRARRRTARARATWACCPIRLPGQLPVGDAAVRERLGKLWGVAAARRAGPVLSADGGGRRAGAVRDGREPGRRASRAAEALRRLDFLVVQDLFLTETAQLADVVLPATSFAEADGTYTNLERRVQRGPQGIQRAVGESRADWADPGRRWPRCGMTDGIEPATVAAQAERAQQVPSSSRLTGSARSSRPRPGRSPKPWNYPTRRRRAGRDRQGRAGLRRTSAGRRWATAACNGPPSALARPAQPRASRSRGRQSLGGAGRAAIWLVSGPVLWDGGAFMRTAPKQVRNAGACAVRCR